MMIGKRAKVWMLSATLLATASSCTHAESPRTAKAELAESKVANLTATDASQAAPAEVATLPGGESQASVAVTPQSTAPAAIVPPAAVTEPSTTDTKGATEATPAETELAFAPEAQEAVAAAEASDAPQTVPVGNPGNKADSTGYGAVEYEYEIGKYEVTNDEYCAFLNAVAKKDSRGLYDPRMAGGPEGWGGITRRGTYGDYSYSVRDEMGNRPVNYVTFESCARYANWLTNGGGDGDTEDGSYRFARGIVTIPDHVALAKEKSPHWVVPSENEWYKAAYYDPNKAGGGYWKYPGKSDLPPKANINTNWATAVGEQGVASAYGTYDQGGNMWEYNDHMSDGKVGLRGGSFYLNDSDSYMQSNIRYDVYSAKWPNYGFRVAKLGGAKAAE